MKHDDLSYKIIGFAYKVHNVLGSGFLESVYENAENRAGKSGRCRYATGEAESLL
jgi:hypothetical protein